MSEPPFATVEDAFRHLDYLFTLGNSICETTVMRYRACIRQIAAALTAERERADAAEKERDKLRFLVSKMQNGDLLDGRD